MMDTVLNHVMRRGMEVYNEPDKPAELEMPTWGIILIVFTVMTVVKASIMIEYTFGHLVAALTMIESPTTAILQSLPTEDLDALLEEKKAVEPEVLLVKQRPITAKFRTTIQHLKARAGHLAIFRGIVPFMLTQLLSARLTTLFNALSIPMGVDAVLAAVLVARLDMAWTHIVMTESSTKYWFQRLPSWKLYSKVVGPTAVLAIAEQITVGLPVIFFYAMRLDKTTPGVISDLTGCQAGSMLVKLFSLVALSLFSAVAIIVPAKVTLTRVQASLLSESEETIVPFDRTFGGKLEPGSAGLSMLDAWKTFDWNSRVRVLKVYLKVVAMQIALVIFSGALVLAELQMITGIGASTVVTSLSRRGAASSPTEV